jgi:hypothetical protein
MKKMLLALLLLSASTPVLDANEVQQAQWTNTRIASERSKPRPPKCSHGGTGCYRNGKHTCACE